MNTPPDRFVLTALRRRPASFRWLWDHHAEVTAFLAARGGGRRSVWPALTDAAAAGGVSVSREALRQAWPVVQTAWQVATPDLRMARLLTEGARPAKPGHDASAASERVFSNREGDEADGFSLPDLTGKKI